MILHALGMRLGLTSFMAAIAYGILSGCDAETSQRTVNTTPAELFRGPTPVAALLATAPNFQVVFRPRDDSSLRVVWTKSGSNTTWDFFNTEDDVPAGGHFWIGSRNVGQRCVWSRVLRPGDDVYVSCGENARPIGPGTEILNAVVSSDLIGSRGATMVASDDARCFALSETFIKDGRLCLTSEGVPVLVEGSPSTGPIRGRSSTRLLAETVRLSLGGPIQFVGGSSGHVEGVYPRSMLGIPHINN
jgi:hypothetical protein